MKLNSLGKLGNRLLSSIIVSALVIIALAIVSTISIRYFLNVNIKGQQALDSIEESANILFRSLIDQETGQRGYILTKEDIFLEPYHKGSEDFIQSSSDLLVKTEKFPKLHTDAKKLVTKGQYWHDFYGDFLVEMIQNGNDPTVLQLEDGKETLDDFRILSSEYGEKVEAERSIFRNEMRKRINTTLFSLVIIITSIVITNVLININILKSVIRPIIDLSNCVKRYKEHDFSKAVPVYAKKDELFELIENVDIMRYELSNSIRSLESKVNVDALTGLYNRRYFNELMIKEWEVAKEMSEEVSLVLFDIDHYKNYNDTYGHIAGDECLQIISDCINSYNVAPLNYVARYGGEEFVVLLLQRSEQEALKIAEEIRQAIVNLRIPHSSSPTHEYVTVSLGVASVVPHGDMQFYEIVSMADKALYESKQNGRNRVTQYQGLHSLV